MITPNSVLLEFGFQRGGPNIGKMGYCIRYDRIRDLSEPDLRSFEALLREAHQKIVSEAQFRRLKEAPSVPPPAGKIE